MISVRKRTLREEDYYTYQHQGSRIVRTQEADPPLARLSKSAKGLFKFNDNVTDLFIFRFPLSHVYLICHMLYVYLLRDSNY